MRETVATVIGTALLIVAALTSAVTLLFTGPVFAWLEFHGVALAYFHGRIDETILAGFRFLDLSFEPREIAHLADVKWLLGVVRLVAAFCVGFLVAIAFRARGVFRRAARRAPFVFVAVGVVVVVSYQIFGFHAVGTFLHEIVFPQGNYSFPFDSLMITLYGPEVMVRGSLFALGVTLALLVAAALAATAALPAKVRPAG